MHISSFLSFLNGVSQFTQMISALKSPLTCLITYCSLWALKAVKAAHRLLLVRSLASPWRTWFSADRPQYLQPVFHLKYIV